MAAGKLARQAPPQPKLRRGPSPLVAKLKGQLATQKKSAKRRESRREHHAQLATLAAGLTYGLMNRKGIALPYVGDLGTATALGGAAWLAGRRMRRPGLEQFGVTLAAAGLAEFVEDSPLLSFLD